MDEALRYYFDEHIDPAIAAGLRLRGIDVLTTEEAKRAHQGLDDPDQLAYAAAQGRVIVTSDRDFIKYAEMLVPYAGVVLLQRSLSIGAYVEYLELLALTSSPESVRNQLIFCDWV